MFEVVKQTNKNISPISFRAITPALVPSYDAPLRLWSNPDSKVHGANMGPIWGRQDPSGPHIGPMDFAIWER